MIQVKGEVVVRVYYTSGSPLTSKMSEALRSPISLLVQ